MMTEMDEFSRLELEERKRERDAVAEMAANLKAIRNKVKADTVASIVEIHGREYTDQQIADVLGVSRKTVTQYRLHGGVPPNFRATKKVDETPALDSAG